MNTNYQLLKEAHAKFGPMPKSIPEQIKYIRKCHEYARVQS